MEVKYACIGTLLALVAGCASTPAGPPEQVVPKIVASLDAGKTKEAGELFDASSGGGESDRLYPLLYEEARGRYQKGESEGAVRVLRFMVERYPKSRAVRESLVYSLFVQRASSDSPPPELVQEIGTALQELHKNESAPPLWIGLVEAQSAIDRGEPHAAQTAFADFKKAWDGSPAELAVYVEDVDRYLTSHP